MTLDRLKLLNETEINTWRRNFVGVELDTGDNGWDVIDAPGAGGSAISVAGGVLTISAGTTANNRVRIRSKRAVTTPCRLICPVGLSQRIANQTFDVELVTADGATFARWRFDGTTTTVGKVHTNKGGFAGLAEASTTIPATTSPGPALLIDCRADSVIFASRALNDGVAGAAWSMEAMRERAIPAPDDELFVQITAQNGAVAPASNTNLLIDFLLVQDMTKMVVEHSFQGYGDASKSLPVNIVSAISTVPVSMAATPVLAATASAPSTAKVMAAATTNPTLVSSAARRVWGWNLANRTASWRFVRLFNKATAPVAGTDVPVITIPIPPNSVVTADGPWPSTVLTLGLGYVITGDFADLDATAVAAGDVVGALFWT